MTTDEEILDEYIHWANTLIDLGEQATEETGDAIPALGAHLVVAYIEASSQLVGEWLGEEKVQESRDFIEQYDHLMPVFLSQHCSAGWLEPIQCSCGDCENWTFVPSMPRCGCGLDG